MAHNSKIELNKLGFQDIYSQLGMDVLRGIVAEGLSTLKDTYLHGVGQILALNKHLLRLHKAPNLSYLHIVISSD